MKKGTVPSTICRWTLITWQLHLKAEGSWLWILCTKHLFPVRCCSWHFFEEAELFCWDSSLPYELHKRIISGLPETSVGSKLKTEPSRILTCEKHHQKIQVYQKTVSLAASPRVLPCRSSDAIIGTLLRHCTWLSDCFKKSSIKHLVLKLSVFIIVRLKHIKNHKLLNLHY